MSSSDVARSAVFGPASVVRTVCLGICTFLTWTIILLALAMAHGNARFDVPGLLSLLLLWLCFVGLDNALLEWIRTSPLPEPVQGALGEVD